MNNDIKDYIKYLRSLANIYNYTKNNNYIISNSLFSEQPEIYLKCRKHYFNNQCNNSLNNNSLNNNSPNNYSSKNYPNNYYPNNWSRNYLYK